MARRHQPVVDRADIRDLVEAAGAGEDRGPVERRHIAAANGVHLHADRAAREHDDDAHASGPPAWWRSGRRRRPARRSASLTTSVWSATASGSTGPTEAGSALDRELAGQSIAGRRRRAGPAEQDGRNPGDQHADADGEDHGRRPEEVRDRPHDDDRQEARDRDEHVENAEDAAANLLRADPPGAGSGRGSRRAA